MGRALIVGQAKEVIYESHRVAPSDLSVKSGRGTVGEGGVPSSVRVFNPKRSPEERAGAEGCLTCVFGYLPVEETSPSPPSRQCMHSTLPSFVRVATSQQQLQIKHSSHLVLQLSITSAPKSPYARPQREQYIAFLPVRVRALPRYLRYSFPRCCSVPWLMPSSLKGYWSP